MQLVEEAVDGCWIGHRARTAIMNDSGIGSVYSPPADEDQEEEQSTAHETELVETVVDIGYRKGVCIDFTLGLPLAFTNILCFLHGDFPGLAAKMRKRRDSSDPDECLWE